MSTATVAELERTHHPALIRRVNQWYHELTQASFDEQHHCRHHVERSFWQSVARVQQPRATMTSQNRDKTDWGRSHPRVLVDLASGTGFAAETVATQLGPRDCLVAIDLSPAALSRASGKWCGPSDHDPKNVGLNGVAADGQVLPLADESVDLLAINAALHHLPNPPAVIREVDRVLKPGGRFALGFEPNLRHFSNGTLVCISRGVDRLAWYLSPRQNRRRLRTWFRLGLETPSSGVEDCPEGLARIINDRLMKEGLIAQPLSSAELLDLVDPHARGAEQAAGFDPIVLIEKLLPNYRVEKLCSSDYLGAAARRSTMLRCAADALFRTAWPDRGSLFSWILRKPDPLGEKEH